MMKNYSNKTFFVVFLFIFVTTVVNGQNTEVGYYSKTCPKIETIIKKTVEKYYKTNPTIAPALLRMIFHDCFVQGCDASLLLDGPESEKTAPGNLGLRAFEVIDDAKSQLEAICPNIVSCADILALASRDAVNLANGPNWPVPTGRLDGRISLASESLKMPSFRDPVEVLKKSFAKKGLNTKDLVTLVGGGHTIGTAACIVFSYRMYNFTTPTGADPTMEPALVSQLRDVCPPPVFDGPFVLDTRRIALDVDGVKKFDRSLLKNLKNSRGILESDQRLWTDASTRFYIKKYLSNKGLQGLNFYDEFGKSMVKLTNIGLKDEKNGEIRRFCSKRN